ncbi:RraA family protein [Leucobacter coleopterorum]|uniref:Putative 4-hydroxy-4-methyl-2-oxoglutarate aldolase n=1 Tax=Leucobacter coleopterorum TaxID=2714933 RepID=A0ABX6JZ60_9MICO|nr:RraA family protein [Leucobacter coleopterorum]
MSRVEMLEGLRKVELPTLGHVLEEGFCHPQLRPMNGENRLFGIARTLDLREPDAVAVNHALLALQPGEVMVIRVGGGLHAPVGAVTAAVAVAQGCAGIVVDGPVTDIAALREVGQRLPVFATGLTARTTKRLGTLPRGGCAHQGEIEIAGTTVHPGDLVLGDAHGVLVMSAEGLDADILDQALASDRDEPELIAKIRRGVPLADLLVV